jgi:hypothetical protein
VKVRITKYLLLCVPSEWHIQETSGGRLSSVQFRRPGRRVRAFVWRPFLVFAWAMPKSSQVEGASLDRLEALSLFLIKKVPSRRVGCIYIYSADNA